MSLYVGYAQSIITPSLSKPVYLAGFGQNRTAQGVHDDLYVRALALRSTASAPPQTLILAALDLIGLFRMHILEIQRKVQSFHPDAQMLIACTHTHHAPDTLGLWGPDFQTCGADPSYIAWLIETVTSTILTALQDLQPGGMLAASAQVPGVARNARNPEILDQELSCLQFVSEESILATLLVFPCHPEVLWQHNPQITADYPGYLRCAVERDTAAPCLFFAGALGGMMTPDVREHSFPEAQAMGKTLAQAALNALSSPQLCYPPALPIPLDLRKTVFSAPVTNPIYHMAIQAGLLPNLLDEKNNLTTETNLLKIGKVWLAGVPGELLPGLGLKLKTELKEAGAALPVVIGLANDELGYILPDEDFLYPENPFQPGDHYEETNSIAPNMGSILMAQVRRLLQG